MFIIILAGMIIFFKKHFFYFVPLNLIILTEKKNKGYVSYMIARQRLLMVLLQVFNLQTFKYFPFYSF